MITHLAAAQVTTLLAIAWSHVLPLEQISDAGSSAASLAGQALAGAAFLMRLLPSLRTLRDLTSSLITRLGARLRSSS